MSTQKKLFYNSIIVEQKHNRHTYVGRFAAAPQRPLKIIKEYFFISTNIKRIVRMVDIGVK